MKKHLVICGSFSEYLHFVRHSGVDGTKYLFVDKSEQLEGIRNAEVVFIGKFWLNPVFKDPNILSQVISPGSMRKRLSRAVLARIRRVLKGVLRICCQKT